MAVTHLRALHPYFKLKHAHNIPLQRHRHHLPTPPAPSKPPPGAWNIEDLCAAYDWPTNQPGRGVIAIVELGGGWSQADVDGCFAAFGQPSPSITDVSVDGTVNSLGSDADGEVALDIQAAGIAYFAATGKPATIRMYWSQDIVTAVGKATLDGCDVCSISWGADESSWGQAALTTMDNAAAAATAAGMVVLAASGDNDSNDGAPGRQANVDAPASCPHVIGCGGTSLPVGNIGGQGETVWNDNPGQSNGSGTGGGFSTHFPSQPWQTGTPPPTHGSGSGRMVPDIAANADPQTGINVLLDGQWQVFGGTSFVAPLYAGLFASFGRKLGFITPELYANKGDFNDITTGNNGAYSALTGPDACTGIGTPSASKIAETFVDPTAVA